MLRQNLKQSAVFLPTSTGDKAPSRATSFTMLAMCLASQSEAAILTNRVIDWSVGLDDHLGWGCQPVVVSYKKLEHIDYCISGLVVEKGDRRKGEAEQRTLATMSHQRSSFCATTGTTTINNR